MVKTERQTLVYYHVCLLRDIKFTGYVANHFDTLNLHLRGKSQPYELSKKNQTNFDMYKTSTALKMIAWLFSSHQTEN